MALVPPCSQASVVGPGPWLHCAPRPCTPPHPAESRGGGVQVPEHPGGGPPALGGISLCSPPRRSPAGPTLVSCGLLGVVAVRPHTLRARVCAQAPSRRLPSPGPGPVASAGHSAGFLVFRALLRSPEASAQRLLRVSGHLGLRLHPVNSLWWRGRARHGPGLWLGPPTRDKRI